MSFSIQGVFADAWALWRRDGALILRLASALVFVPMVIAFLLPDPPAMPAAASAIAPVPPEELRRWSLLFSAWLVDYGVWKLVALLVTQWATLTLLVLFLDPRWPTLGQALRRGLALIPVFVLAGLLTGIPVALGFFLFVLPGLYVLARLILVGAVLAQGRVRGPIEAIATSFRLTHGAGLKMLGLVCIVLAATWLASQPLLLLDTTLRRSGDAFGLATLATSAALAIVSMLSSIAMALLQIAAYRRLASIKGI